MIEPASTWAAQPGPPNGVFVLALLTAPKVWSTIAADAVRNRFGRGSE